MDEEGLELAVKEPPGPVLETKVLLDVSLDDFEGNPFFRKKRGSETQC